ncbi:MAG: citrate lyase holo-[Prevotella sp.]|nr:citrate lyase holo-[acyl-carrier protein] synthase [Prevotella sp.]
MEITLEQLLASRDDRHEMQQKLLRESRMQTLVCLTVIMPGRVKRNELSIFVADVAVEALYESELYTPGNNLITRDLETGYEAYLLTPLPQMEAKRIACGIEESHPLGRLFDLDIIGKSGIPVSREAIGLPPRQCLLCERESRYCMRNHSHTQEEIHTRIQQMIETYKANV